MWKRYKWCHKVLGVLLSNSLSTSFWKVLSSQKDGKSPKEGQQKGIRDVLTELGEVKDVTEGGI